MYAYVEVLAQTFTMPVTGDHATKVLLRDYGTRQLFESIRLVLQTLLFGEYCFQRFVVVSNTVQESTQSS